MENYLFMIIPMIVSIVLFVYRRVYFNKYYDGLVASTLFLIATGVILTFALGLTVIDSFVSLIVFTIMLFLMALTKIIDSCDAAVGLLVLVIVYFFVNTVLIFI